MRRGERNLLLLLLGGLCFGFACAELLARLKLTVSVSQAKALRSGFRAGAMQDGFTENGHWEESLSLHPFFGYVGNPARGNVNRFGFYTKHQIQLCGEKGRLCWADDALTIGIFGGSLAGQVASDEDALAGKLQPLFPGKKIKVVNFALAGQAQPQALHIFSYFRDLVQVAVFIDGLNEIWNPVDNNRLGLPPVYAKALHYRGLAPLRNATDAKERFHRATQLSLLPLWRETAVSHFIWLREQSFALDSLGQIGSVSASPFFSSSNASLVRLGVEEWKNAHLLAGAQAKGRGIRVLRLLQPTLLAGGKSLTAGEQAQANAYPELARLVKEGYPLLAQEGKKLGVINLSALFDEEAAQIWIDAAHVNAIGITRLRDAVANALR